MRSVAAVGFVALAAILSSGPLTQVVHSANGGSIKGRVQLNGKSPGNTVIRMAVDPMCSTLNAGKRPVQEAVVTSPDGGLANVFVRLEGTFPQTPVPATPILIDQSGCIYSPRVIGARVGQTLRVRNSDGLLHNVHSMSKGRNSFNVGQPAAGMTYDFKLVEEEFMLRLGCDVHRWMTSYIGVANHPYFAVSNATGGFEIANVPPGSYTIRAWHEQFGELTEPVRVRADAATTLSFAYTSPAKP